MAWYDSAAFYQIYPLGLCGCPHENHGETQNGFAKLTEWAEHARALHCTALYLGPLFQSGSHGYDTTDYRLVDTRLGTNADFAAFVRHCHEIGLRVIVDGVFNHVGRDFAPFRDVRQNRERSAYCGWFCNLDFGGNNSYGDGFRYANWGGHDLLVKLNQQNPAVQQYHFDTVRFWAEQFGIDGIRLDAADVLDFGFLHNLRAFCETLKPDFWLMGEVIHGDYGRWTAPGMLHSVTNYALNKGLWSGHNEHNYFEIAHTVRYVRGLCGDAKLLTFADNHDVARIASMLQNPQHLPLVMLLIYGLPGVPCLYYGSEFGAKAQKQPDSDWNLRPALALGDFAVDAAAQKLAALATRLGALKETLPALSEGDYRELLLQNRQFAFARVLGDTAVIFALNCDDAPAHVELAPPVPAAKVQDLLAGWETDTTRLPQAGLADGRLKLDLPANTGTVLSLMVSS
ncbi:MAG: alpha-amylase family glycosyl hydrolase [Faecalibacterium sp.]|jgi:glycosidase|nr:alpha-amylase family glycosyl hydrolase [Faecalibacterium sp.]